MREKSVKCLFFLTPFICFIINNYNDLGDISNDNLRINISLGWKFYKVQINANTGGMQEGAREGTSHHGSRGMGQEDIKEEGTRVKKREGKGGNERQEEKRVELEEGLKDCHSPLAPRWPPSLRL